MERWCADLQGNARAGVLLDASPDSDARDRFAAVAAHVLPPAEAPIGNAGGAVVARAGPLIKS